MATSSNPTSSFAMLAAEVAAAAAQDPVVAHALQEERAALSVAAAVAEVLESRNAPTIRVAELAGISLDEFDNILAGTTEGTTSIATLSKIAAALDYRFGFSFVPNELSLHDYARYAAGHQKSVEEANPGLLIPDYREVP